MPIPRNSLLGSLNFLVLQPLCVAGKIKLPRFRKEKEMASKPKPAPIYDKHKKSYRLHFCCHGKQYRQYYIPNQQAAYCLQSKINQLIIQFKNGLIAPAHGVSLQDFIFNSAVQKPTAEQVSNISLTTLSDLIEEYRRLSMPPAKAASSYATEDVHLKHLQKFLAQHKTPELLLAEVEVGFFNSYKRFRYDQGVKTDTVNKELSTFQGMFRIALENRYVERNVVRDVKRDKSEVPCDRFRTRAEINELLSSGTYSTSEIKEIKRFCYLTVQEVEEFIALTKDHWLYPIIVTAAYTGMRRGELSNLQWADVDMERKIIHVKSHKQSQKQKQALRSIPIHERLFPVLQEQKLKTDLKRWVFAWEDGAKRDEGTMTDTLRRLVTGGPFEGIGYHAFRHSVASNLAQKGADQREIDQILGHQTEAMRKRYQHLFPKQIRNAIDKLTS
jgi:integrase